jgi:hypothetical protein
MLNIKVLLFQEPWTLADFAVDIEEMSDNDQILSFLSPFPVLGSV